MRKRLTLSRETLHRLSSPSLIAAKGGSLEPTTYSFCFQCATDTGTAASVLNQCTVDWTNCRCLTE